MKIDTAGNYTLRYTATDSCGNSSSVDRPLTVASPRTVLYADGTFIINESPQDKEANEALHGAATNEYIPFNPNVTTNTEGYHFTSKTERPWNDESADVIRVEIGSHIQPVYIMYWFMNFTNCTSMDLSNLDTSQTKYASEAFMSCSSLTSLDVSHFDTRQMESWEDMFRGMSSISVLDLSSFDSESLTSARYMFAFCRNLKTIYATSKFDVTNKGSQMFYETQSLVGGAGTPWSSSHQNGDYARIDNPPDAPGYFTLKPTA